MKTKKSKRNHILVVEMQEKDGWKPTIGCGITKDDGIAELERWRRVYCNDKFRLKKYVAED